MFVVCVVVIYVLVGSCCCVVVGVVVLLCLCGVVAFVVIGLWCACCGVLFGVYCFGAFLVDSCVFISCVFGVFVLV